MQVSQFRALRRAQSTIYTHSLPRTLARAFSAHSDASVEVSEQQMLRALDKFQKDSASNTVPWFLENMPPSYFRSIHEEDRLQHLNAITALVGAEQPEVLLRSPDERFSRKSFCKQNDLCEVQLLPDYTLSLAIERQNTRLGYLP